MLRIFNSGSNLKSKLGKLRKATPKSNFELVTPIAASAAPKDDPLDESDRHASEYESGAEEEHSQNENEDDGENDTTSAAPVFQSLRFNNPLKVSREVFLRDPAALGIDGIDKYSTYDEYEAYIDSAEGFQAEMAKLHRLVTSVKSQLDPPAITQPTSAPTNTTVIANSEVYYLKGEGMGYAQCKKLKEFISRERVKERSTNRIGYIDAAARFNITLAFLSQGWIKEEKEWLAWSDDKFFEHLLKAYPRGSAGTISVSRADKYRALRLTVDFRDSSHLSTYTARVTEAEELKDNDAEKDDKIVVDLLLNGLSARTGKNGQYPASLVNERLKQRIVEGGKPATVTEYMVRLYREHTYLGKCYHECRKMGFIPYKDNSKFNELNVVSTDVRQSNNRFKRRREESNTTGTAGTQRQANGNTCNACGKLKNHTWADCLGRKHPEHNPNENVPWSESDMGKAWARQNRSWLSMSHLLNGERWKDAPDLKKFHKKKTSGEILFNIDSDAMHTRDCHIFNHHDNVLTVATLFDTGALQANYVSLETAARLKEGEPQSELCRLATTVATTKRKLNLAAKNHSSTTYGVVSFNFSFLNELTQEWDTIKCLTASIIDTDYDLIIGKPTMRKHKLTRKLQSYFESDSSDESGMASDTHCSCCAEGPDPTTWCDYCTGAGPLAAIQSTCPVQPTPISRNQILLIQSELKDENKTKRIPKKELLNYAADPDDTQNLGDVFPLEQTEQKDAIHLVTICGPNSLQTKLHKLVIEFKDIHSESVRPEPANIPPLELKVNHEKWEQAMNRLPPRPQSQIKESELRKQVSKAIDLNVLQPSTATAYSQVILVPKPAEHMVTNKQVTLNGSEREDQEAIIQKKWRFCVDYVRLNDATESVEVFPIPNMQNMIRRIGEKRPKYFAVMDLTSGYHQAPLSINSRKYTAFICFLGLLEWLRVPMGLKGAPSYFQRVLATIVLSGLIYIICELYIDDVCVFGQTEEEFIHNLREVFLRFRKYNLTLNPKKCKYGISKVEYVGHVIDENGVTFSDEKREKVLTFPLPTHMKQLKKFLGLANYFRDHVINHSDKVRPLQKMIDDYDKKKRLHFTPELESLYNEIRDEIGNCPTLFFLDPQGEIFVQTDASDYGIGAYIFQKVNGVERPTLFISKTLNSTQCKWSTPEKEAYAIYYALTHAEHLLRDVRFVLQTDHRNLTFINMEGSPKIRRWKLAIQEYDFEIEYLPGEKNVVADNFSRLCDIENPDETLCTFSELRIPNREYRLISQVHNSSVGHHGVERTIDKLHKQGHKWSHLREHVRKFIRQCPCCQLMSHVKIPIKTHPFTRATYQPMECLNVDTIGPVPKDQFGNEHILVIIDCFTRFVELYPIPDTTALSAARAILNHAGRYGVAAKYRTDNGPQYANELLTELRKLLRTEHEFTIPYSKEENSIVERANKEVMRHLRAIIFDSRVKNTWSMDYLPLVMRILNAEEKERTGVSPAELLFGNTIQLDRRMLYPVSIENEQSEPMKLSSHMEKLLKAQGDLIKIAQELQATHDEYHMSKYESGFTEFPINSYVLLAYPEGERPSNKMKTNLQGPFS